MLSAVIPYECRVERKTEMVLALKNLYSSGRQTISISKLIKASLRTKRAGVVEFQLSYFKFWKMMLWKCCTQYASKFENSAVATRLEKVHFHSNPKECLNYHTIALSSHASKVMLKILQARLQQYVNRALPDVQAGFRKGRGTRDRIANIRWIINKAREFQKKHLFLLY